MRSELTRKVPQPREWLYWNYQQYTSVHPSLAFAKAVGAYEDRKIFAALEQDGRRLVVMRFDQKTFVWFWQNGRWAGVNQLQDGLSKPMAEFYAKEQMETWIKAELALSEEKRSLVA